MCKMSISREMLFQQIVKNLVEFRRARRNRIRIVFSGGVYVGKHTLRPASVEFVCLRARKLCARQDASPFNRETNEVFPG